MKTFAQFRKVVARVAAASAVSDIECAVGECIYRDDGEPALGLQEAAAIVHFGARYIPEEQDPRAVPYWRSEHPVHDMAFDVLCGAVRDELEERR